MNQGHSIVFIFIFFFSSSAFSALGRSQKTLAQSQSCLVKIKKSAGKEEVICSANHVGKGLFKSAAHCYQEAEKITLYCQNEAPVEIVEDPWVHPEFDPESPEFKMGERKFDLAILDSQGTLLHLPSGKIPRSWEETRNIILQSQFCFFTGYGVNDQSSKIGTYQETSVPSDGIQVDNQFLVYERFLKFTVMMGDSGGSLYCVYEDHLYDIGTSSGKDLSQRSLMVGSYRLHSFFPSLSLVKGSNLNQEARVEKSLDFEIGKTYKVRPYSILYSLETKSKRLGNVDNNWIDFTIEKIEGTFASGTYENRGSSVFFVCIDGVICNSKGQAGIFLEDLREPSLNY